MNKEKITYRSLIKNKLYLGILIVLGCATIGSVWGARTESKQPLNGVTQEEIEISLQEENMENVPILTGIIPMAASQNNWLNFKYAFFFAVVGILVFLVIMAIYRLLYYTPFFITVRKLFGIKEGARDLFV